MLRIAIVLLALTPLCAAAQPAPTPPAPPAPVTPAIKLPATLAIASGKLGKLVAETSAKTVKWVALTPGLSIEAVDGGRTLYFTGAPGSYDLLAYVAVAGEPSDPVRVTVTIGEPPAPVPPPAPPAPTPPAPVDPLKAKIAGAYIAATGTADQKKEWAKDLSALYGRFAKTTADPKVTTAAALKSKISAAASVMVGDTALTEVRQVVAGELAQILGAPTDDATLTPDQRTAAAALFVKLAGLLDGLTH